jgi:hypothetical protein
MIGFLLINFSFKIYKHQLKNNISSHKLPDFAMKKRRIIKIKSKIYNENIKNTNS